MSAAARVWIRRGGAERVIDVDGGEVTIGRGPGQTLRLAEADVALAHAALLLGDAWAVEARGGAVVVGGAPLAPRQRAVIAPGAIVQVGAFTLIVDRAPAGTDAAGPVRTASLARELVRDLLGGEIAGGPVLTIVSGPNAGQALVVPPPPARLVVGRGDEADAVVLDDGLSRAHAAFERDDDGVRVIDLGSKNGTRVRGERVGEDGRRLVEGDVVALGATRIQYRDPAEEYLRLMAMPVLSAITPAPAPAPAPVPAAPRAPAAPAPPPLWPIVLAGAIAVAAVIALVLLLV